MSQRLQVFCLSFFVAVGVVASYMAWTVRIAGRDDGQTARGDNVLESMGKPMDERFKLIDHLGRQAGPEILQAKVRLVFLALLSRRVPYRALPDVTVVVTAVFPGTHRPADMLWPFARTTDDGEMDVTRL